MPGPKFVDTTVDTAMAQPWASSIGTRYRGVPLGIDMKDGRMINFDPWWLKANGFLKSTTAIAYGPLDHGKSAMLKIIAWRLAMFVMGFSLFKLVINDRKPEGSDGEYGALSRAFGC
ncbi:MAG: hypothetical protein HIU84_09905, partial [Acidobacteria bacterium]|nr:hypothetical protein [Acidobacteriota bacterium]